MTEAILRDVLSVVIAAAIVGIASYQAFIARRIVELDKHLTKYDERWQFMLTEKAMILSEAERKHAAHAKTADELKDELSICQAQCSAKALMYAREAIGTQQILERVEKLEKTVESMKTMLTQLATIVERRLSIRSDLND